MLLIAANRNHSTVRCEFVILWLPGTMLQMLQFANAFHQTLKFGESNFRHFWCCDNSGGFIVLFSGKKASLFSMTYFSVCLVGVWDWHTSLFFDKINYDGQKNKTKKQHLLST